MGRWWNIGKVIGLIPIMLSGHFACVLGGDYDTLVSFCFNACYWFMCWEVSLSTHFQPLPLNVFIRSPCDGTFWSRKKVHLVHELNKILLLVNYFLQVFQVVMGNLQIQRAKSSQCTIFCQWFMTLGVCWMSMIYHENKFYLNDFIFEIKLIRF